MAWKSSKPNRMEPITSTEIHEAWMAGFKARLSPAAHDTQTLLAWAVDFQIDFLDGSLTVPGGWQALAKFIQWAYDNIHRITHFTASADDHMIYQIFHPAMWEDADGNPPPPTSATSTTVITLDDIKSGRWIPTYNAEWQMRYVFRLEKHRKALVIWPYHCLRSTNGANLAPALLELMAYWSGARNAQYDITQKGSFWGSEQYAPQEALVPHPDDPNAKIVRLYDEMEDADVIVPAGIAENFCLDEWFRSNIAEFGKRNPEVLKKFDFDREFTAPIPLPNYESGLREQYQFYVANGITVRNAGQFLN